MFFYVVMKKKANQLDEFPETLNNFATRKTAKKHRKKKLTTRHTCYFHRMNGSIIDFHSSSDSKLDKIN
jgi:hypothetical protein